MRGSTVQERQVVFLGQCIQTCSDRQTLGGVKIEVVSVGVILEDLEMLALKT